MSTTPERHLDDIHDDDRDPVDREPLGGSFDDMRPPPPPAATSWPSSATEAERSDDDVPEPADPILLDEPVIVPEASATDTYGTVTDTESYPETDAREETATGHPGDALDSVDGLDRDDRLDTVGDTDSDDGVDSADGLDMHDDDDTGSDSNVGADEPALAVDPVSPVVVPDTGTDTVDDSGDEPVVAPAVSRRDAAPTDEVGDVLVEDPVAVRERWQSVQVAFVDDPRQAVDEAGQLVDEVVELVVAGINAQRDRLGESWSADDLDTEQLRLALRRYRQLLDRLLAV